MTLIEEAQSYSKSITKNNTYQEYLDRAYIAGATSKYVQIEKLKFAMEQLDRAKDLDIPTVYAELKKKLKILENE